MIRAIDTTKTTSAVRRTCRGERKEAARSTASRGDRDREPDDARSERSEGRAARRPAGCPPSSARVRAPSAPPTAASSQRSIVHHQLARAERSARDTIAVSSMPRLLAAEQRLDECHETDRRAFRNPEIDRKRRRPAKAARPVARARSPWHRARPAGTALSSVAADLIRKGLPDRCRERPRWPRRSDKP